MKQIIELQNISIADYCKMLRANSDKELTALIDAELSKSLEGLAGGFGVIFGGVFLGRSEKR